MVNAKKKRATKGKKSCCSHNSCGCSHNGGNAADLFGGTAPPAEDAGGSAAATDTIPHANYADGYDQPLQQAEEVPNGSELKSQRKQRKKKRNTDCQMTRNGRCSP